MSVIEEVNAELDSILAVAGTLYLSTVDGDKPACRPVGFKMLLDGKLYFGVGTSKDCYKQVEANPNVQVVGCAGPKWIRVSASAAIVDDPAVTAAAFEAAPFLAGIYNEQTGNKLGLFYLENGKAEFVPNMMGAEKVLEF